MVLSFIDMDDVMGASGVHDLLCIKLQMIQQVLSMRAFCEAKHTPNAQTHSPIPDCRYVDNIWKVLLFPFFKLCDREYE